MDLARLIKTLHAPPLQYEPTIGDRLYHNMDTRPSLCPRQRTYCDADRKFRRAVQGSFTAHELNRTELQFAISRVNIIIIIRFAWPARAVASLHHHVHGRQHASRGLKWDVWNRIVAGRATCSVDDQVGDATCGQEVG